MKVDPEGELPPGPGEMTGAAAEARAGGHNQGGSAAGAGIGGQHIRTVAALPMQGLPGYEAASNRSTQDAWQLAAPICKVTLQRPRLRGSGAVSSRLRLASPSFIAGTAASTHSSQPVIVPEATEISPGPPS